MGEDFTSAEYTNYCAKDNQLLGERLEQWRPRFVALSVMLYVMVSDNLLTR